MIVLDVELVLLEGGAGGGGGVVVEIDELEEEALLLVALVREEELVEAWLTTGFVADTVLPEEFELGTFRKLLFELALELAEEELVEDDEVVVADLWLDILELLRSGEPCCLLLKVVCDV